MPTVATPMWATPRTFNSLVNLVPGVLFDPGYDEIDATVVPFNGRNYLFDKDETGSGKDIQVAKSVGAGLLAASFTPISPNDLTRGANQNVMQGTEGRLVIKVPGQERWYTYADYHGNGGVFGCWTTANLDADPATWTQLTNGVDFKLPDGVRHANTVRVTQAQLDALKADFKWKAVSGPAHSGSLKKQRSWNRGPRPAVKLCCSLLKPPHVPGRPCTSSSAAIPR